MPLVNRTGTFTEVFQACMDDMRLRFLKVESLREFSSAISTFAEGIFIPDDTTRSLEILELDLTRTAFLSPFLPRRR